MPLQEKTSVIDSIQYGIEYRRNVLESKDPKHESKLVLNIPVEKVAVALQSS